MYKKEYEDDSRVTNAAPAAKLVVLWNRPCQGWELLVNLSCDKSTILVASGSEVSVSESKTLSSKSWPCATLGRCQILIHSRKLKVKREVMTRRLPRIHERRREEEESVQVHGESTVV